jgi:hypothetical protein
MELFARGIIDSVKGTFRRWRRNGPQITNLVPQSAEGMGENVRISGDGTVVAIWIPNHNYSSTPYNGAVRVFKINSNGTTTPMGDILLTDSMAVGGTRFGQGMSLNYDGTRLAVSAPYYQDTGRVTVYNFASNQWTLIGTFLGTRYNNAEGTTKDNYGVSLNAAGTRLAVFLGYAPPLNRAEAKVYDYDGTTWAQVGQTIQDGVDATLSASGDVLFTGSKTWSLQSGTWVQTGSFPGEYTPINGTNPLSQVLPIGGTFNSAGTRFVLRYRFPASGANWHFLRTFNFANGAWTQVGSQLVYTTFAFYSYNPITQNVVESSISQTINPELSADGSRMIVWGNNVKPGQVINAQNTSTTVTGRVMIYDFVTSNWVQQSQIIYEDSVKSAADLSADGKTIAYGLGNNRPRGLTTGSHGVTEVYRKELD